MFGRGRQDNLPQLPEIAPEALPYLPIAQSMQERVAERLSQVGPADMDAALSRIIAEQEDALVQQGIEAKIEALPTLQLLGLYARVLGDDSVNEPIRRLGELRRKQAEREAAMAELKAETQHTNTLDLSRLHVGQVVTAGLYHPNMARRSEPTRREVVARKHDDHRFVLVSDTIRSVSYSPRHGTMRAGALGAFGNPMRVDNRDSVTPFISKFSAIAMEISQHGDGTPVVATIDDLAVGWVEVDNEKVIRLGL
ncbi:MAG: hypothetical protein JWN38_1141 [Candidatus Saccharibacteria bacterium]|nr:hypothetical protein [Candidatus Saccharibacteria bacterium]